MQHSPTWNTASIPHLITAVKSRLRQVAFRYLSPHRLSPQQYQLLMAIYEEEGLCQGDLARITWMDKPTASRILKTLQDRGLVRPEADPNHGRKVRFRLTPEAEPVVQGCREYRKLIRAGIEAGLDDRQRAELRSLLGALMDNLDRLDALLDTPEK